jgi:hypothetical protein
MYVLCILVQAATTDFVAYKQQKFISHHSESLEF